MADVFPASAGAIASWIRALEVHIWRTSEACPASRAVPFAAISSTARCTAVSSTADPLRCPAVATRAVPLRGSAGRCRCRRWRRCRPRTRLPAATPPVPGCCQPLRRGSCPTCSDAQVRLRSGRRARRPRGPETSSRKQGQSSSAAERRGGQAGRSCVGDDLVAEDLAHRPSGSLEVTIRLARS